MSAQDREELLSMARDVVVGDREDTYGAPEDSFERIAKLWSVIFGQAFSPADVALAMALVKVARLSVAPKHQDSWVDLAGYAACGYGVTTQSARLEKLREDLYGSTGE